MKGPFLGEHGLCILRVEPHEHVVVLTVTTMYFPEHGFHPHRTGPSTSGVDAEAALASVREFLDAYSLGEDVGA